MIDFETEWVRQNSPDPADPTLIDWPKRQAEAWVDFPVIDGRPRAPRDAILNMPPEQFIRGRNDMKFWGENKMADALVTCTLRGDRYVLLIERGDGAGWAMPGGAVEPGEEAFGAAMRELQEETGLILPWHGGLWTLDEPCWVLDPRGSMEAWAATQVARADLGPVDSLPEVRGADDARAAEWALIDPEWGVDPGYARFPAHREILAGVR